MDFKRFKKWADEIGDSKGISLPNFDGPMGEILRPNKAKAKSKVKEVEVDLPEGLKVRSRGWGVKGSLQVASFVFHFVALFWWVGTHFHQKKTRIGMGGGGVPLGIHHCFLWARAL